MKKNIVFALFAIFITQFSYSQLSVITGVSTPTQYVTNNLIGPGVIVSNVTFTGNASQIGEFNGTTSNIGFNGGLVLSSGAVTELVGPASSTSSGVTGTSGLSDPDLLTIANIAATAVGIGPISSTHDASILEFDFVPQSNIVSFNFVFASEEYLTWINSVYNDAFGFFVSGPGITGPFASPAAFPNGAVNLALVPNTNLPITISTIHPSLNSQYYVSNAGGTTHAMNGFTTPIPVSFSVQCGETYHFKFAVADCEDNSLSTAVFLEDDSFTSPPVGISFQSANGSDTIPEACVSADILFIRSLCQSSLPLTVDYVVSGTAIDGTDFNIAASPVILAAGQDTAFINIAPIIDGLVEGTETIIITVNYLDILGNPQSISGTIYIADIEPLSINETDLTFQCYNDSIELTAIGAGGSGVYTYDWQQSASDSIHDYVSINQNGTFEYIVTLTDFCLGSITDTVTVMMNQTLVVDTMMTGPATCEPVGWASAMIVGETVTPAHGVYYSWENSSGSAGPTASVWTDLSSGWYYVTVEDAVCTTKDSIFVDILNPPIAQFSGSPTAGCDPLTVLFTNNSQNALNYAWDFGNGNTSNVTNTASQTQIFTSSTIVRLIASQGNCADTAYVSITISICGCMDPLGTNYNPSANFDDGSCMYPLPTVEVPNVFTPDGDNVNDQFFLVTTNSTSIELTIKNRWGNTVYESVGINPAWNGKTQNGIEVDEGVYFYKYKINGYNEQYLEGHGFLHLVR